MKIWGGPHEKTHPVTPAGVGRNGDILLWESQRSFKREFRSWCTPARAGIGEHTRPACCFRRPAENIVQPSFAFARRAVTAIIARGEGCRLVEVSAFFRRRLRRSGRDAHTSTPEACAPQSGFGVRVK